MPYRKKGYRKKTPRKTSRSYGSPSLRLGNYRRRKVIPRSLFPNKTCVQMTYATTVSINPGASATTQYHDFAANGLFDPDLTGVGHQPRGFDQLTPFYKKLTVVGSKITCIFTSGNADGLNAYTYGVLLDSTGQTPPTDYNNIIETGMAKVGFGCFDNTPGSIKHVTKGFSAKKHMSVTNPLDEPNLSSDSTANPSKLARYHVFCGPVNQTSDQQDLWVQVTIRYTVVCTDRIRSSQS